jgi:hypothetical protein
VGHALGERERERGEGRRIYAERKLAEGFRADEVNPMVAAVMCCLRTHQGDRLLEELYRIATHCPETVG